MENIAYLGIYYVPPNIPFIEAEAFSEHCVSEPHLCFCVQENLIEIICDSTTVLNFPDHVTHSTP